MTVGRAVQAWALAACLGVSFTFGEPCPGIGGWTSERVLAASPKRQKDKAAVLSPREGRVPELSVSTCPAQGRLNWRELKINPNDTTVHVGLKTYPQTLRLMDHEVVLTFDDGPSPQTTPAVLAALRAECVRVNFFLIGRHADAAPELVRQEVVDGHIVGHHSYTHPSFTLRGFDEASGEKDIDDGIKAVERAAYGSATQPPEHPHVPFFRFPGFADSPALLDFLDKRGFAVFGTDIWAADWLKMTPEFESRHVLDQLEHAPLHSGIVLFHDTRPSTAAMLPAFLRELKSRGYHVVQLIPAGSGPAPLFDTAPLGWTSQTEAIISRAWPKIYPTAVHSLPTDGRPDVPEPALVDADPSQGR